MVERRIKVRHLSTVHDPHDTRVTYKECRHLVRAGFDVALIACIDEDTVIGDVPILALGRPRNRIDRMVRKTAQMYRRAIREDADVYHFHDPELLLVGLLLRLRGRTVVYDVHEDVPKQIMNKFWIPAWLKRPLSAGVRLLEGFAARRLDAIVAATPSIAERFPGPRTIICQNFPELALVDDDTRPEQPRYAFAYVGGLSEQQGLFAMLDALALLPDDAPPAALAGKFKQLRAEAEAHPAWSRVEWLGVLPREEVVDVLRQSAVGVVLNHPISNYLDAYSTKMFEYMAMGLPVVSSDIPLWADIVDGAGAGVAVSPFDPQAVADAIRHYLDHPDDAHAAGDRGREAARERFNWEAEAAKLVVLYERLTSR